MLTDIIDINMTLAKMPIQPAYGQMLANLKCVNVI